jgi:hypothetical protein
MSGASQAGNDMEVGRTNESEVGTRLVAIPNPSGGLFGGGDAPDGYEFDYVLDVALEGDFVVTKVPVHGVDAIHATGSIAKTIGGEIGTQPAGNGIVGRGMNGIVGYVQTAARDVPDEQAMLAGVLGEGGGGAGVVGRGQTGVVGVQGPSGGPSPILRDPGLESGENAGIIGYGGIGVTGKGFNGPGVHGIGTIPGASGFPGVHGESTNGVGVWAEGSPGLQATSPDGNSGLFEANPHRAQVWIVPMPASIDTPTKLAHAEMGELCVTVAPDGNRGIAASLWFCMRGGGAASAATWVKIV